MTDRKKAFEKGDAKIPTGVRSIDLAVSGGLPSGSLVILSGASGSGVDSFFHTACFMNAAKKEGIISDSQEENTFLPENIIYILLSKTKNDILRDINVAYSDDLIDAFKEVVQFKDLMSDQYSSSLSSLDSLSESSSEEGEEGIEVVRSIVDYLEENGQNSLIVLDSLDDLIRGFGSGSEKRLLDSLKTVRSRNRKDWNSLIFVRLTEGIFPESVENSIFSLADGVFKFSSKSSGGSRTREIICEKFSGVTSGDLLDSTFEFEVTNSGLEARRTTSLDI